MTSGESYPGRPIRTSSRDRLASLPSPQELVRPQQTTRLRYATDEYGLPIAQDSEMPFTAADSGEIRQATLPAEEAFSASDAQWMSADEMAAFIQQAEQDALLEFQGENGAASQSDGRRLKVRYSGPDAQIKLEIEEGLGGNNIDRILGAFTGIASQPAQAPRVEQPQQPYYLDAAPLDAIETIPPSYQIASAPDTYLPSSESQPLTIDSLFDTSMPQEQKRSFVYGHRKGVAALIALASAPFWYDSVGDVVFEAARQGINGEVISVVDAYAALHGQPIESEKE